MEKYDVIIVGAGPAGITAGIYANRYGLKTLIIGKDAGQTADAWVIENYPGVESIKGMELMDSFRRHAEKLGIEVMLMTTVSGISKAKDGFVVKTGDGQEFSCKAVVLAIGMQKRKMGLHNENKFLGKGVSYCATCDAAFFKGKIVGVVGGNDSAVTAALLLAEHSKQVYIIYRKEALRAEEAWLKKIRENPKIKVITNALPKEVKGDTLLRSVVMEVNGKPEELKLDGLFIEIGHEPETSLPKQLGAETDENGRIKIDDKMLTNVPGVFAAGDVTGRPDKLRQIITAAAEGAIAATSAYKYIKSKGE
jgi:thioredoxin reductase (NADPH)